MIGIIFANTTAQGIAKLNEIQKNYEALFPDREPGIRTLMDYRSPDEDQWKVALLNTSARGLRCNVAYVPQDVDNITFNSLVLPAVTRNPFQAIHYY